MKKKIQIMVFVYIYQGPSSLSLEGENGFAKSLLFHIRFTTAVKIAMTYLSFYEEFLVYLQTACVKQNCFTYHLVVAIFKTMT